MKKSKFAILLVIFSTISMIPITTIYTSTIFQYLQMSNSITGIDVPQQ
ncbi:MAG: hypothetical protein ACTSO9_18930 [Candidatus Helarchaeota archaeon]